MTPEATHAPGALGPFAMVRRLVMHWNAMLLAMLGGQGSVH